MHPLSDVGSSRGAPMGRSDNIVDREFPVAFEVERLKWVDGAYDEGGAYWGGGEGENIFRFEGESDDGLERMFVRAKGLADAKTQVIERYPNATFEVSSDLDAVIDGYTQCALWSSSNPLYDEDPENEAEMLDGTDYDLAPEAEAWFRDQCERFFVENEPLIREAIEKHGYNLEQAGHDFWLDQNGHGAGFRDRGLEQIGEDLAKAAKAFVSDDLYVGDDKLIHASSEYRLSAGAAHAPTL